LAGAAKVRDRARRRRHHPRAHLYQ
jgi:hypothetical protein